MEMEIDKNEKPNRLIEKTIRISSFGRGDQFTILNKTSIGSKDSQRIIEENSADYLQKSQYQKSKNWLNVKMKEIRINKIKDKKN